MDRVIKFRGKRIDNGEWVYGDLENPRIKDTALIHCYRNDGDYDRQHKVEIESVGQFTGCLDKNGTEIYEGDVVKWIYTYYENDTGYSHDLTKTSEVFFRYGIFSVKDYPYNLCECDDVNSEGKETLEVIGNIFDNPELLKGGDNE